MFGRLFLCLFLSAPLWANPTRESLALQEMRSSFQELNYRFNSCQSDLDLLSERLNSVERSIQMLPKGDASASRLATVEATQKTLADDIKTLKTHLEKTNAALHKCEKELANLDKQLTTDIASLKSSLKSMIVLLKGGSSEELYVVKPGDSLGQIALNHKTTTKKLKEHNNLTSDTIIVGQKLAIP